MTTDRRRSFSQIAKTINAPFASWQQQRICAQLYKLCSMKCDNGGDHRILWRIVIDESGARARSAVHVPTGRLDSIACRKVYLPTSRILFQLTFSVCHTQNHYYYYYLCQSAIGHKRLAIPHTAQTASAQSANVNSNAERSVGWMGMALFQAAKKEPNCQIFANA